MILLNYLNSSKAVFGIAMVTMNFGSKYVVNDISQYHEYIMNSVIGKKIILFCMFLVGTRDIMTSLMLFSASTIILDFFINEKSKFNLLPSSVRKHFLKNK